MLSFTTIHTEIVLSEILKRKENTVTNHIKVPSTQSSASIFENLLIKLYIHVTNKLHNTVHFTKVAVGDIKGLKYFKNRK